MPIAAPDELGRELSDLAFGIIEQNWLAEHIGKAVDVKGLDPMQASAAEWELTYLILFAITSGCGTCAATDRDRTTAALKAFHSTFLKQIGEQVGQDIANAHEKNLVPRYRLYGQTLEGEDTTHPYKTRYQRLGEAAAIQLLGNLALTAAIAFVGRGGFRLLAVVPAGTVAAIILSTTEYVSGCTPVMSSGFVRQSEIIFFAFSTSLPSGPDVTATLTPLPSM